MGCRRASSTTLLLVTLAVVVLLALDRPRVAHARHVRNPSMSTGEHLSKRKEEGLQGTRSHGAEHSKNTETVRVEKGPAGEAAAAAGAGSLGRRGGNSSSSPAANSAEKVVVARYGPRPHPKKHN